MGQVDQPSGQCLIPTIDNLWLVTVEKGELLAVSEDAQFLLEAARVEVDIDGLGAPGYRPGPLWKAPPPTAMLEQGGGLHHHERSGDTINLDSLKLTVLGAELWPGGGADGCIADTQAVERFTRPHPSHQGDA